jgi:iron complex outermembrane receptor protein
MSRKEQRVVDTAAAAYVITGEEIRRSGAMSIPEALRMVPGLNVAQISRDRWAVSSRGFNERFSSKLLVLVDGRSIYSPMFSGVLWETQDTLMEDIERIEVIRGPGAALWGTNAMNGVINIVTRSAKTTQGNVLSAQVGTGGYGMLAARHGGELEGGGHYSLYGKSDGMNGSIEKLTGIKGDDHAGHQRIGLKLAPQLATGELSFKTEAYRVRSNDVWISPSVLAFSTPGKPFEIDSPVSVVDEGVLLQARYSWKNESGSDSVLQAYVDHESSFHQGLWGSGSGDLRPVGIPPSNTRFGGVKTDVDIDFQQRRIAGAHDVIWGLAFRYTSDNLVLPSGPYRLLNGKDARANYSAFIHDDITLKPDRLKLILGSKFEHDGLTGFNIQPNARVLWTPSSSDTFWGALSKSVRSPRRTESLATIDVAADDAAKYIPQLPSQKLTAMVQVTPQPGAGLMAEKAISLEGGWRKQINAHLNLDTSLFVTDYSALRGGRLIGPSIAQSVIGLNEAFGCMMVSAAPNCYLVIQGYNSNKELAKSWGGEIALDWHPSSKWRVQGSYAYLKIQGVHTGDLFSELQVSAFETASPRHQFSLRSNYVFDGGINLDLWARRNSQTSHFVLNVNDPVVIRPYTALDARLAWQVDRQLELAIMGKNLLNGRHSEFISILPYTRAYDIQRSLFVTALWRF